MTFLVFLISAAVFAGTFWLSIRLVDGYNSRNTLPTAAFVAVFITAGAMFGGPILGFLPLVATLYLLVRYYDLTLIRAFASVFVMALLQFGLDAALTRLVG